MHELKRKYDKIFDDIFFSKDFKNYMLQDSHLGYCPNGLTINTEVVNDVPEFYIVCKEYNYDYSNERVLGDYVILPQPPKIEQLTDKMMMYLSENHDELLQEILSHKFYL